MLSTFTINVPLSQVQVLLDDDECIVGDLQKVMNVRLTYLFEDIFFSVLADSHDYVKQCQKVKLLITAMVSEKKIPHMVTVFCSSEQQWAINVIKSELMDYLDHSQLDHSLWKIADHIVDTSYVSNTLKSVKINQISCVDDKYLQFIKDYFSLVSECTPAVIKEFNVNKICNSYEVDMIIDYQTKEIAGLIGIMFSGRYLLSEGTNVYIDGQARYVNYNRGGTCIGMWTWDEETMEPVWHEETLYAGFIFATNYKL